MYGRNNQYSLVNKYCVACGRQIQQHSEDKDYVCTWLKCQLFGGKTKMISIDGKYFIKTSTHGFDLVKKGIVKEGKNKGQECFENKGFYTSLSSVRKAYEKTFKTQDAINAEVANDLKSLVAILEKIDKNANNMEVRILEALKERS